MGSFRPGSSSAFVKLADLNRMEWISPSLSVVSEKITSRTLSSSMISDAYLGVWFAVSTTKLNLTLAQRWISLPWIISDTGTCCRMRSPG